MDTLITGRDLQQRAPHSPRDRIGGFAIACRAIDKSRSSLNGTLGEYHYDSPLDKLLFEFKGITAGQFTASVQAAATYEDIGLWLQQNGTKRTATEIAVWSDEMEAYSPVENPMSYANFVENCNKTGLDPMKSSAFDCLEADDRASFMSNPAHA